MLSLRVEFRGFIKSYFSVMSQRCGSASFLLQETVQTSLSGFQIDVAELFDSKAMSQWVEGLNGSGSDETIGVVMPESSSVLPAIWVISK